MGPEEQREKKKKQTENGNNMFVYVEDLLSCYDALHSD